MIDNTATHPTPEGLMLTLMPAGLMPRLSAWLFDLMIRIGVMIVVSMIAGFLGTAGFGLIAIVYFLLNWLYPVYFEVYRHGMTPGKKRQGIYVCHDDGTPITLQSSMVRNLLRTADFLPIGFMAGSLSIMFNKRSQRLGDMVAGTLVVYQQQNNIDKLFESIYGAMIKHNDSQADAHLLNNLSAASQFYSASSPLFFYPLKLNEQQAMVAFAERLPFLTQSRQQEITSILTPLVQLNTNTPMVGGFKPADITRLAVITRAKQIEGAS